MNKPKYDPLPGSTRNSDDETQDPLRRGTELTFAETDIHHSFRKNYRPGIYTWMSTLFLTVVIFILGMQVRSGGFRASSYRQFKPGDCGKTLEEAQNNGCVMDFISGSWVKTECYDEQLEKEFLGEANWHWYADPDGHHELPEAFVRQTGGPNPLFVTKEYHNLHCAYTWMKLHRAILRNAPIDSHIGNYVHTNHCSRAMIPVDDGDSTKAPSAFYHIFARCDLPQNSRC